jgi:hypothetical protein
MEGKRLKGARFEQGEAESQEETFEQIRLRVCYLSIALTSGMVDFPCYSPSDHETVRVARVKHARIEGRLDILTRKLCPDLFR